MRFLLALLLVCSNLFCDEEFFYLMGKETNHWAHVTRSEDVATLDKLSELYDKNKSFRFASSSQYKIPKIIHFIWLGPRPFPSESVQNVRTWLAHHPDWRVKFWTDKKRPPPCNDMLFCDVNQFPFLFLRRCYEESENWGEKSDILRFEILYQEGGIYVDHDANCLQKFDPLNKGFHFYCGLESPHPPFAGRNITCGNGVIGSCPFHPIVGRVIEKIDKDWGAIGKKYKGRDSYSKTQLVLERTYIQLTDSILKNHSEDGNIDIAFPAAFFFAKKDITPIYSEHFFANTWADDSLHDFEFEKATKKAMAKLRNRNKTIRLITRTAIAVNGLILIGIIVYLFQKKRRRSV